MLPKGLGLKEILTSSAYRNVSSRFIIMTLVRDRCDTNSRSSLTKLVKQKTTGHRIKTDNQKSNREGAIHRIVKFSFLFNQRLVDKHKYSTITSDHSSYRTHRQMNLKETCSQQ